MHMLQQTGLGLVTAVLAVALSGCAGDTDTPSDPGAAQGAIRVQCERQASPDRSKISVDGNNLVPQNGAFRARVSAAGGSVTSPARQAAGDEVEFDFDSNPNDIRAGATRIGANFIRNGSVRAAIFNAAGNMVAGPTTAACEIRR